MERTAEAGEPALEALPYPLARPVAALTRLGAGDAARRFEALVDLDEAIARTAALLALSTYVAGDRRDAGTDALVRERLLRRAPSLGDWVDLADRLLQPAARGPAGAALPEVARFWAKGSGKLTPEAAAVARFVRLRNEWAHRRLTDAAIEEAVAEFSPSLDAAAAALGAALDRYDLVVPLDADPDPPWSRVAEAVTCRGVRLEPAARPLRLRCPVVPGDDLVLVDRDRGEEVVRLFPMVLPELGRLDGNDDLLVYERARRTRGAERRVARLHYVGVATRATHTVDAGGDGAHVLAAFSARLSPWLDRDGDPEPLPIADDGVVFSEARERLVRAVTDVVGRDELVDRIVATAARGPVLLLGAPGAGKSAIAALAAHRGEAAVHFAGRDGGRDDVRLAARSLLAQVLERHRLRRPIPDERGAALKALHDVLDDLGRTGDITSVVIDAMDELEPGPDGAPDLSLVPGACPPGLRLVLTARPGPVADALAAVAGVARVEVGPLDRVALARLAERWAPDRDPASRTERVARADGHPLFLRLLLENDEPGDSIEAAFAGALERARARGGPAVTELIALLVASRDGLARRDVAKLLGLTPFAVRPLLEAVAPLVAVTDGRHRIFHASLREWLVDAVVGPDAMKVAHERLADHLVADAELGRATALRELLAHLVGSGRVGAALDRLDGDHLVALVRSARSPEAARADLRLGVDLAKDDLPRAARLALLSGLLSRAALRIVRSGVAAALARHGDPRLAASLARMLPDPDERARAILDVAVHAAEVDRGYASELTGGEIPEAGPLRALGYPDEAIERLLAAPPGTAADLLAAAVARQVGAADRLLRVRTLLAALPRSDVRAAWNLPADEARALARNAVTTATREESASLRAVIVPQAIEALARFDGDGARAVVQSLPLGLARVLAGVVLGELDTALADAEQLPPIEREAGIATVVIAMARSEPERALARARAMAGGLYRDQALLEVARTALRIAKEAASAISDAGIRARAFAAAFAWSDATEAAASAATPAERASAFAWLAREAGFSGQREWAEKLEQRAREEAAALEGMEAAAVIRERVGLGADAVALARAEHLDPSYGGLRAAAVARARAHLSRRGGARDAVEALRAIVPFDDAPVELYPAVTEFIAGGEVDAGLLRAMVAGLGWAESMTARLVLACSGDGGSHPQAPRVDAALLEKLRRGQLETRLGGDAADAERLARRLRFGSGDAQDLEALVTVRLRMGDRRGAAQALIDHARRSPAEAAALLRRARELDPQAVPAPVRAEVDRPHPASVARLVTERREASGLFNLRELMNLDDERMRDDDAQRAEDTRREEEARRSAEAARRRAEEEEHRRRAAEAERLRREDEEQERRIEDLRRKLLEEEGRRRLLEEERRRREEYYPRPVDDRPMGRRSLGPLLLLAVALIVVVLIVAGYFLLAD